MNKLKTIEIKGKLYVEVNERIKYFRENYKEYSIITEIIKLEEGICVMKAQILDRAGIVLSTGHAYEKEDSTFINKTSYIENCETSAVGRALGNLGIGIDTSVASAEEVQNAINNQKFIPQFDPNCDCGGIIKIETLLNDKAKVTCQKCKKFDWIYDKTM